MEVYCIKNLVNDKEYVGVTTRSIDERFEEHCKAESYIGRAIRKHGVKNFIVYRIDEAMTMQELWEKEIYWIKKKKTFGMGYNLTIGGGGVVCYDPTVEVILNDKQKKFVKWVDEENKKPIDIDDSKQMIRSIIINTMKNFLIAELIRDKKKTADMITRLKPIYFDEVMRTKVINTKQLNEWIA